MTAARAKDPLIEGLRERLAAKAAAEKGVVREGFRDGVVEEGLAGLASIPKKATP
jgi:hypothetical protein